jgi:hypothetical protein
MRSYVRKSKVRTAACTFFDASHAEPVEEKRYCQAGALLRASFPGIKKATRQVRQAVARRAKAIEKGYDMYRDLPGRGRKPLEAWAPKARLDKAAEAIRAGTIGADGQPTPFLAGEGLRDVPACRALLKNSRGTGGPYTPQQLQAALMRLHPDLMVCLERARKPYTDAQKADRLLVATARAAELNADPNWHNKVVCIDACKRTLSQLVGAKRRVITSKAKNLATRGRGESRLGLSGKHQVKMHWMVVLSGTGARSGIIWLPTTSGYKAKQRVSMPAHPLLSDCVRRSTCSKPCCMSRASKAASAARCA